MDPAVDQRFGNIQRMDPVLDLSGRGKHTFVHADPVVFAVIDILQGRHDVICVEDRIFTDADQSFASEREQIGISTEDHAEIAVERGDVTDRLGAVIFEGAGAVIAADHAGDRKKRDQGGGNTDRTRAGAASAMRRGKGFMQVHMHHVEPDVAGADASDDRVEIRAVAIAQASGGMDQFADFLHVRVEKTERIRTGQHDAGDFRRQHFLQGSKIDIAVRITGDGFRSIAGDRGAGGIGSVRGVRNQHDLAGEILA